LPLNNPSAQSQINSGSYTGNNTAVRAIPHGLTVTPKLVFIYDKTNGNVMFRKFSGHAGIVRISTAVAELDTGSPDATNFYVGNAGDYTNSANLNAAVYAWVAIG